MSNKPSSWASWLGLLFLLGLPLASQAGPPCNDGCEPSSYSRIHYLAPRIWRLYAHHQPKMPMYAADLEPGVPTSVKITYFPCPYAHPAEMISSPSNPR